MIVLDTNVMSELMRADPAPGVVEWVDRQASDDLYLSAVTVAELLYGVGRLPTGRRKRALADHIGALLAEDFDHRILAFDEVAAAHYADIVVRRERSGASISMADAQIAAICRSTGATLVTRNVDDFLDAGIAVVDAWRAPGLRGGTAPER